MVDVADRELPEVLEDFVLSVDMQTSGSTARYLGHDSFGIYDYPPAERWLRDECIWPHTTERLGDGSFHFVTFQDPRGAVEFKLRWGREG